MVTIRAIIVDDEKGARESLAKMIERNCKQIEIVAKADSMKTAFELINEHTPDLVFLDIEMPKGNAFDLLGKFSTINFDIIFTTAYDHYAIRAIKFSAVDYLLKPIDPEDLIAAVNRFDTKQKNIGQLDAKFQTLLSNVKPNEKLKKIVLHELDSIVFIKIEDIVYCISDSNYTTFVVSDGSKITSSRHLGEYEHLLEESSFCRVHRSTLINLIHVKKYIKGEGGQVLMSNNDTVEVSRRNKQDFFDKLENL